ncbi:nucleotidyltransferase domain-containing protein [Candidatus Berkelbacteria bacterium]|nr:nucleotidyltransferase domain-containing protein [Candidatus Berkelbacteria bacterium]
MDEIHTMSEIADIARQFGLDLIVQFGSTVAAPSFTHQESDIDIAVSASQPLTPKELIDLQYAIAKFFGVAEDAIDIVDLHRANSLVSHQVTTNGKVLFDNDGHQFNEFYVATQRRFIDEAPLYQLESDSLTRKVKSYDR